LHRSLHIRRVAWKDDKESKVVCQSLPQVAQLIGSDWVWGLLVPEVPHRLPLIPGVGEGGKAHAAGIGGREFGGEGFNLVTGGPTRFTWLTIRAAQALDAGEEEEDGEEEAEGGHHVRQAD